MLKRLLVCLWFLILVGCANNSAPIHRDVLIIEKERIVHLEKQLHQEEKDEQGHEVKSSFGNAEADHLRKNAEKSFNEISR